MLPMKRLEAQQKAAANNLQRGLENSMREMLKADSLLALIVEGKLKKKGVRLAATEKQRLRDASAEFLRSGDASVLGKAITRKRKIHIELSPRDAERLEGALAGAFEKAVTKTGEQLARSLESEVKQWADAATKWTVNVRGGFQERLERTWREPFRRYARFRRLAEYILELAIAHFGERKLLGTNRLAKAMLLLQARACLVAGEVETLMCAGYADGAAARWRTLHEISVTAAFLIEHGEGTADRYLAHFPCEQLKGARLYEEHRQKLGYGPLRPKFVGALEAEVDELKKRYGDDFRHDNGWAAHALQKQPKQKVNFAEIESAVKLPFMRPFYKLASEQVHASSRGAIIRGGLIRQTAIDLQLLAGPSNYGFADAAMNSARALLLTTVSLGQVDPTLDTNVMSMILAKWSGPLMMSLVKAQRGIEERDRRLAKRRTAKRREGA
jgi:Family of unknown function (DUF5677)